MATQEIVQALWELAGAWECAGRIAHGFERLLKERDRERERDADASPADVERRRRSRSRAKRRRMGDVHASAAVNADSAMHVVSDIELSPGASCLPTRTSQNLVNVEADSREASANAETHVTATASSNILSSSINHQLHAAAPPHISVHKPLSSAVPVRIRPGHVHQSVTQVLLSPSPVTDSERAYFSDTSPLRFARHGPGPSSAWTPTPNLSFSASSGPDSASLLSPDPNLNLKAPSAEWRGGAGYFSDESYLSDAHAGGLSADEQDWLTGPMSAGPSTLHSADDGMNFNLELDLDYELRALCGIGEPDLGNGNGESDASMRMEMNMDSTLPGMGMLRPSALNLGPRGISVPKYQNATLPSSLTGFDGGSASFPVTRAANVAADPSSNASLYQEHASDLELGFARNVDVDVDDFLNSLTSPVPAYLYDFNRA